MNQDELKKLIEKYEAGASTLEEEQLLFEHAEHSDVKMAAWSNFVKQNRSEVPQNLNEELWHTFENKNARKRRIIFGIIAAAASILLALNIFVATPTDEKQSYAEKKALLEEARSMLAETKKKEITNEIIYENEFIMIYNKIEILSTNNNQE